MGAKWGQVLNYQLEAVKPNTQLKSDARNACAADLAR